MSDHTSYVEKVAALGDIDDGPRKRCRAEHEAKLGYERSDVPLQYSLSNLCTR
jgi:hypothetical protein